MTLAALGGQVRDLSLRKRQKRKPRQSAEAWKLVLDTAREAIQA